MAKKRAPLSPADARAILANASSYGVDWQPAKSVSRYSDATARRYAGNILAGKAPDRGHSSTPEHGRRTEYVGGREIIVARNRSDAAKARTWATRHGKHAAVVSQRQAEAQRRQAEGGSATGGGERLGNGAERFHGSSKRAAAVAARYARDLGESDERRISGAKRVQVVVYDREGGRHLIGAKGGMHPQDVLNALSGRGGIAAKLSGLAGSIYEHNEREMDWEPSGEFDIIVL